MSKPAAPSDPAAPIKRPPKGHRQKGAGTVIHDKPTIVTADGVVLKSFERLPGQLLSEYCQREKRPMPQYEPIRGNHFRVVLEDPKHNAKNNMTYTPAKSDYESAKVAKDYAALIALYHLQKTIPLERKLPEPYRSAWLSLISNKGDGGGGGGEVTNNSSGNSSSSSSGGSNSSSSNSVAAGISMAKPALQQPQPRAPTAGQGISAVKATTPPPATATSISSSSKSGAAASNPSPAPVPVAAPAVVTNLLATHTHRGGGGGGRDGGPQTQLTVAERELLQLQKRASRNRINSQIDAYMATNTPMQLPCIVTGLLQLFAAPSLGSRSGNVLANAGITVALPPALQARLMHLCRLVVKAQPQLMPWLQAAVAKGTTDDRRALERAAAAAVGTEDGGAAETAAAAAGSTQISVQLMQQLRAMIQSESSASQPETMLACVTKLHSWLAGEAKTPVRQQLSTLAQSLYSALVCRGWRCGEVVEVLASVFATAEAEEATAASLTATTAASVCRLLAVEETSSNSSSNRDVPTHQLTLLHALQRRLQGGGADGASLEHLLESSCRVTGGGANDMSAMLEEEREAVKSIYDSGGGGSALVSLQAIQLIAGGSEGGGGKKNKSASAKAASSKSTAAALNLLRPSPNVTSSDSSNWHAAHCSKSADGGFGLTYTFRLRLASVDGATLCLDIVVPPGIDYPTGYRCAVATDEFMGVSASLRLDASISISELQQGVVRALQHQLDGHLKSIEGGEVVAEPCVLSILSYVESELLAEDNVAAVKARCSAEAGKLASVPGASDNSAAATGPAESSTEANEEGSDGVGAEAERDDITVTSGVTTTSRSTAGGASYSKRHPFWVPLTAPAASSTPSPSSASSSTAMSKYREQLPAFAMKEAIVQALLQHDSVVITGETGSGKTTQTPQFIHEYHQHQMLLEQQAQHQHHRGGANDHARNHHHHKRNPSSGGGGATNAQQHHDVKILICQPRRLAAITVAERVAQEMRESSSSNAASSVGRQQSSLGGTVGYMIKGDVKAGAHTRILFCTYGVLLRCLQSEEENSSGSSGGPEEFSVNLLQALDYIILDEVHERGCDGDVTLALLRNIQKRRNSSGKHKPLKLIIMSATVATNKIASYLSWEGHGDSETRAVAVEGASVTVPILHIPGRTFPVTVHYKNEYERFLRPMAGDRASAASYHYRPIGGSAQRKGDVDYDLLIRLLLQLSGCGGMYGHTFNDSSSADGIDSSIVLPMNTGPGGGGGNSNNKAAPTILVFLPGVPEINRCYQMITREIDTYGASGGGGSSEEEEDEYSDDGEGSGDDEDGGAYRGNKSSSRGGGGRGGGNRGGNRGAPGNTGDRQSIQQQLRRIQLHKLHGAMSPTEQQGVFSSGNSSHIKVVLSTNVAEASVTIPNVSVVIDSCRVKQLEYDCVRDVTALTLMLAARDSLQQRTGRAGRVCAGRCYRLITQHTYETLAPHSIPELQRIPLENVLLQLLAMDRRMLLLAKLMHQQKQQQHHHHHHQQQAHGKGGALDGTASSADVSTFLGHFCLDAPSAGAIATAMNNMVRLHAVEEQQRQSSQQQGPALTTYQLSQLGELLSQLPTPAPRIGKVLVYGVLLQCVLPGCYMAALLSSSRSIIVTTPAGAAGGGDKEDKFAHVSPSDSSKLAQLQQQVMNVVSVCSPASSPIVRLLSSIWSAAAAGTFHGYSEHLRLLSLLLEFHIAYLLLVGHRASSSSQHQQLSYPQQRLLRLYCHHKIGRQTSTGNSAGGSTVVSYDALLEAVTATQDYLQQLTTLGYVTHQQLAHELLTVSSAPSGTPRVTVPANTYGDQLKSVYTLLAIACIATSASSTNIASLLHPPKRFVETIGGAIARDAVGKEYRFYITKGTDATVAAPAGAPARDDEDEDEAAEDEEESPSADNTASLVDMPWLVAAAASGSTAASNSILSTTTSFKGSSGGGGGNSYPYYYFKSVGHYMRSLLPPELMERVQVKYNSSGSGNSAVGGSYSKDGVIKFRSSYLLFSEKRQMSASGGGSALGASNLLKNRPSPAPTPGADGAATSITASAGTSNSGSSSSSSSAAGGAIVLYTVTELSSVLPLILLPHVLPPSATGMLVVDMDNMYTALPAESLPPASDSTNGSTGGGRKVMLLIPLTASAMGQLAGNNSNSSSKFYEMASFIRCMTTYATVVCLMQLRRELMLLAAAGGTTSSAAIDDTSTVHFNLKQLLRVVVDTASDPTGSNSTLKSLMELTTLLLLQY